MTTVTLIGAHSVSEKGLRFIEAWEGCVLKPYNDSSGYATVGIGHLLHRSLVTISDVQHFANYRGLLGKEKPHPFDQADALALLSEDVQWVERDVLSYIHPHLTHTQFDAVSDLIFNCGPAPLTGEVGRLLNAKEFEAAGAAMLLWCHSNGEEVPGLLRRREAEQQLLLHGTY